MKHTPKPPIDLWILAAFAICWLPANHLVLSPWLRQYTSPESGIWWWITGLDWLLPLTAATLVTIAYSTMRLAREQKNRYR